MNNVHNNKGFLTGHTARGADKFTISVALGQKTSLAIQPTVSAAVWLNLHLND